MYTNQLLVLVICLVASVEGTAATLDKSNDGSLVNSGPLIDQQFVIDEIEGNVLVWRPWDVSWSALKVGDVIIERSLLQSTESAKLYLHRKETTSNDDDALMLAMSGPTMLRLHPEIIRKVALSSFTMDSAPPSGPNPLKKRKSKPTIPLIQAWRRARGVGAVMPDPKAALGPILESRPTEKSLTVSIQPPTITIKTPTDGGIIAIDRAPTEIAVDWSTTLATTPDDRFLVYLWPMSGEKGEPARHASKPPIPVTLPGAGGFYLLVTSGDGAISSDRILINVEELLPNEHSRVRKKTHQ